MPRFLYHTRRYATIRKFINPTIPLYLHRNVTQAIVKKLKCSVENPELDKEIRNEILRALCALVHHQDITILVDSVLALAFRTDFFSDDQIQLIIDAGVVPFLVSLLGNKELKVQSAALTLAGNLVTGSDEQTQVVLNCGALAHFTALLSHSEKNIKKDALWFLSNITAGNQEQIQAVIDAGLLPEIIRHLGRGVNFEIKERAAWAVSNMTNSGNNMQIMALMENNAIQPLCNLLTREEDRFVEVCLEAIYTILRFIGEQNPRIAEVIKECGGVDKIESLQNSNDECVSHLAGDILELYFQFIEDVTEDPPNDENQTMAGNQLNNEGPSINQDA